jgi:hypothetical protein
MNWKKALLVLVIGTFALVFFTVAAVGCAATAAVTAAAAAIDESGVVQAFEEVADGAERLQVDIDENALTVTNLDTGESMVVRDDSSAHVDWDMPEITVTESRDGAGQIIVSDPDGGRGQLQLNMPGITVDETANGGSRVVLGDPTGGSGSLEFELPGVTVTRGENGVGQVVIREGNGRAPRVVWDGDYDWDSRELTYGPEHGIRLVGELFRAMFTLVALVLIAAGAILLLRNRRQVQAKAEDVDKTA